MMKKTILSSFLMLSVALSAQNNSTPSFPDNFERTITVTGFSERKVAPNEIYLRITLTDKNTKLTKQTVDEQEKSMIKALKALGIETDKQLKVGDMNSTSLSAFWKKDRIITFKTYSLKLNNAFSVAKVFEQLEEIGIWDVKISKTTHSDLPQIKKELRAEAMKNAKEIAQTLAQSVDQTCGKALQITVHEYPERDIEVLNVTSVRMAKGQDMNTTDQEEDPLQFKDLTLNYSVYVKFQLD